MKTYRISTKEYIDDLSGKGAELVGGRWNLKGTPAVYTAANVSLATLETFVHNPSALPLDYRLATVEFDDSLIRDIDEFEYDSNYYINNSSEIGNELLKNGIPVLKVPSVVIPFESGYVLNPKFIESFKVINIQPFLYDRRLIQMLQQSGNK